MERTLKDIIESNAPTGEFIDDARGWKQWHFKSQDALDRLNLWMANQLTEAIENHADRWNEAAENAETYRPVPIQLANSGGKSILPAPTSRTPADQIIASTVNNVTRQPVITSFDPHFNNIYDVMIPVESNEMREMGAMLADEVNGTMMVPGQLDSEVVAHEFERKFEFECREKLNFFKHFHEVVYRTVSGQKPWWYVFAEPTSRDTIAPKVYGGMVVATDDEEEVTSPQPVTQWRIVQDFDVLRPNFDQDINSLEWGPALRNRDLMRADSITRSYKNGELFLIKDDKECETCANTKSVTVPDAKQKTDASIHKVNVANYKDTCDVWDVPFLAWLKTKDANGESIVKQRLLFGHFHRGVGKFMAIYRYPYRHLRRNLVPFRQYLDDNSTVGLTRHAQILQTHMWQAEIRGAMGAAMPIGWYDPDNAECARYLSNHTGPWQPNEFVPGAFGTDWGFGRASFEHYSLLELMQYNEGTARDTTRMAGYNDGNRVVSHTSPKTVDTMLDRGDANQDLFLQLLNESWREVVRLTLETEKQYNPTSDHIPVRDPKTKTIQDMPFFYPVRDVLDNFYVRLTASDATAARERDPDQMSIALEEHKQFTEFAAQVLEAMKNAQDPADIDFFMQVLRSHQEIYNRKQGMTRIDLDKFDLIPAIEKIKEARVMAIQESVNAINTAAANGAATGAGTGANPEGLAGAGIEPGMAEGAAPTPDISGLMPN